MRKLALITLVLAAASGPATAAVAPRVALSDRSPTIVRGVGFRSGERVQVTVAAGGVRLSKAVLATASGAFTARWQRALPSGCVALLVNAVGSKGSHASLRLSPPECAPPIDP